MFRSSCRQVIRRDNKGIVRRLHLDVVQMEKIPKLIFTVRTVQDIIPDQDIDNTKNLKYFILTLMYNIMDTNDELKEVSFSEHNDAESNIAEFSDTDSNDTFDDYADTNDPELMIVPIVETRDAELIEDVNKVNGNPNTGSVIVDLLKLSIYNPSDKLSIKLPKRVKDLLGKLIEEDNTLFNKIETNLLNIIKDNSINASDVPDFIAILIIIYETMVNNDKTKIKKDELADTSGIIIKFIIDVLVTENVIKIEHENRDKFLVDINRLVDTCVTLVKLSKSVKAPSCLKRLFR